MGDDAKQSVTLSKLWERRAQYSGNASDHVRTSALAGLAVAWLFAGGNDGSLSKLTTAPTGLLIAAAVFAASLGADILHYFIGDEVFRRLARKYELLGKINTDEVDVPSWTPKVPAFFYKLKVVLLFAGYVVLVVVFIRAF